jgi:hypothetical protein
MLRLEIAPKETTNNLSGLMKSRLGWSTLCSGFLCDTSSWTLAAKLTNKYNLRIKSGMRRYG